MPEFTTTEAAIRHHLTDTYGSDGVPGAMIDQLAPDLAQMYDNGAPKREFANLIWMNFAGGDTAYSVADRIYEQVPYPAS